MFCEHCGKQIADGTRFCEFCGAPVGGPQHMQRQNPIGQENRNVQQELPIGQSRKPKQPKDQAEGKGLKIAIVASALAILFVACVGAGMWIMNQKNKDTETTETAEVTQAAEAGEDASAGKQVITPQATATPTPKTVTPKVTETPQVTAAATVTPAVTTPAATQTPAAATAGSGGDYMIADSNTRMLTNAELDGYTADQIRLIRNEIYAREGYIFTSPDMQNYFGAKSWYHGTIASADFTNANLNSVEYANIQLITEYEKSHNINQS